MSAIASYNTHGIAKNSVRQIVNTVFFITEPLWSICDDYTLLYWSPSYTKENIEDGTIRRLGKEFQVRFIDCTPEQVYKHTKQIMLSFRVVAKEYELPNVVLIKLGK